MSRRMALAISMVSILILSLIISSCTASSPANQSSYVLGITGTATTVTVTGASPKQKVSELFGTHKYTSYFYSATEARTEPVVCEYDQGGYHFVVRDNGGPDSMADSLCAFLADLQAGRISSSSGGPGSPDWPLTYASSTVSANHSQTPTTMPKNTATITALVTSTIPAGSATVTPNKWESERKLFPVWQEGKLGFINSGGEIKITPQFDRWGVPPVGVSQNEPWLYFSEGLCAVSLGGRVGFIDEAGTMVINPEYLAAFPFSDSFALVFTTEANKCFIDSTGRRLNVEGFADANPFVDGMARVYSQGGQVGWVDTTGKLIGGRYFDDSSAMVSDGVIAVAEGGKWGYIDTQGKTISPAQFDFANDVYEGLGAVVTEGKTGFVDKAGNLVIEPKFDSAGRFSEGLADVMLGDKPGYVDADTGQVVPGGKWGFIDKTGKQVIDYKFDAVADFHEGLAGVRSGDKWGYTDRQGAYAIQPQFDEVTAFSNGYAWVRKGDKIGRIDESGHFVVQPQFDLTAADEGPATINIVYHDDLAAVSVGLKWGYINREGHIVVQPQYDEAYEFSGGLALVQKDRTYSYIDTQGRTIWRASGQWGPIQ